MKNLIAAVCLAATGAFAAGGTISGTVQLSGAAPKAAKISRKADPVCAKSHPEMDDPTVSVGKDGKGLDNVFVRVIGPTAPGSGDVTVNQHECMYEPRVQGAVEGQKVMIKNEDGTLHNVHAYNGTTTLFNQAQPPKSKEIEKAPPANAQVITLKCDVHPWMKGFVVMNKNPYFTVSKDGHYEITGVPAGTYKVEAWQEKLGTKTVENVKVADGAKADANFSF